MSFSTIFHRHLRYAGIIALTGLFIFVQWNLHWMGQRRLPTAHPITLNNDNPPLAVIVAAVKKDNLTLLQQESGLHPGDEQFVYVADDPTAEHAVPMNKGNEAMVYLSFMIDRYDSLPDIMVFMHAGRQSWHNNYLFHLKSAPMVQRLRRSYVHEKGFVNLRCDRGIHCKRVHNATDAGYLATVLTWDVKGDLDDLYAEFHRIWDAILPGQPIPPSLGTPPGAQFALTRETVRKLPLEELKRLREWIMAVDYNSQKTGAVFEFLWQIIFLGTQSSVLCPLTHDCYCSLYGICLQSLSSDPEKLMQEILTARRRLLVLTERLLQIQHLQTMAASSERDEKLASLSHGHIGPGLKGASDYARALEGNITEWADPYEQLLREASMFE